MDDFTQELCDCFYGHEWLVKTDNKSSTPYLFKFHPFQDSHKCALIVTDTKSVSGEVLNTQQLIARWKACNPDAQPIDFHETDEWISSIATLLSSAHTLAAFPEASIEVGESRYSDVTFNLSFDTFGWKWETSSLGKKLSSEILSKHLILPLIGLNHLSFTSSTLPSQFTEDGLQSSIDKVGRTARRALDTHVKNALSKPAVATGLSRLTCLINSHPSPPHVKTTLDSPPTLQVPEAKGITHSHPPNESIDGLMSDAMPSTSTPHSKGTKNPRPETPIKESKLIVSSPAPIPSPPPPKDGDVDSEATESSDEEMPAFNLPKNSKSQGISAAASAASLPAKIVKASSRNSDKDDDDLDDEPDSRSPPTKLVKRSHSKVISSDLEDDADGDALEKKKKRSPSATAASGGKAKETTTSDPAPKRGGTRQPLKRGKKRF